MRGDSGASVGLETSVSADCDGAGVQFTEPTAFDDGASQTAAGAGAWVCVDVFRVGCVAVIGCDADEHAAWVTYARCQAPPNRLPVTRVMKHPQLIISQN